MMAMTDPMQYPVERKMLTAFLTPFIVSLQSAQVQNAAVYGLARMSWNANLLEE